jgi:ATP-dependent helicase HrpA
MDLPSSAALLEAHLSSVLTQDRPRLIRLWQQAQKAPPAARPRKATAFQSLFQQSHALFAQRLALLPTPDFPENLPVSQHREALQKAILAHQVIIVCGETGSGKTTQLPKLCLALGRGVAGLIGHTQPRRLAARNTAARIAQELGSPLGQTVGYKIRFTDRLSPTSAIKLMTDGILLAETQSDPDLLAYDTIIIDEAHERSLNIDFLLGYLKTLLPRRPDLKLIITSATLDAQRFAQHFARPQYGLPPVFEVSGRLFPIELHYRPIESFKAQNRTEDRDKASQERDLFSALVDTLEEAWREGGPGDALVFLPGEREIREAAQALRTSRHASRMEILPLFARQSAAEQARVFSQGQAPRVVLATNVAETSLTVPGIRYVIDTGLARIKRYSVRNKVEQLQVEKIAKASAAQRAGRCGRVMNGVCYRLYDEADFEARPAQTEPEILRSSLAGVILRMKSLRLGDVESFPFLEAPTSRAINDGYQLLLELGALSNDAQRSLTPLGEELARLPLDPRLGRMILAARHYGALREVLVIVAALSVQDPRDRPPEKSGSADQAHALFRGNEVAKRSEFLWYWQLWQAWDERVRHDSGAQQKAWCKKHFLSPLRMREWRDVYGQLHVFCAEHGWVDNTEPATFEAIHKALLSGLLGNIGMRQEESTGPQAGAYTGARGIRFWPHPSSVLAKKAGKWVMTAELVDTSRLFARCLARIEPDWVVEVAEALIQRHVDEPHWSKTQGRVQAFERGTLYGLTLYQRKPIPFTQDPALCREWLIREGLMGGAIAEPLIRGMGFLKHNHALIEEIERLEQKARRPDVLVDEALIFAFYDHKIPEDVTDMAAFEAWRKKIERQTPRHLYLEREQLMRHEAAGITTDRFPAVFRVLGQPLPLSYRHEPGREDDGISLEVPLPMLNQIPETRCQWLVPGLLEEKVLCLLKTVPPRHRHRLQPMAESAAAFMAGLAAGEYDMDKPLLAALPRFVEARIGLSLSGEHFRAENLPAHCFMHFRVVDAHGRILAQGRDLPALQARFSQEIARHFAGLKGIAACKPTPETPSEPVRTSAAQKELEKPVDAGPSPGLDVPVCQWSFGTLPELIEMAFGEQRVLGFPALVDQGESGVVLRPFDTPEQALKAHKEGLLRLFRYALKDQIKAIGRVAGLRELGLRFAPMGTEAELRDQLIRAALGRCALTEPLPMSEAAFLQRVEEARPRILLIAQELVRLADGLLAEQICLSKRLQTAKKAFPLAVEDMEKQLAWLLPKQFMEAFAWERLSHFPRYLKAIGLRLEKLRSQAERDAQQQKQWQTLHQVWEREWQAKARTQTLDPSLEDFRWLLEELRVGLFAQELKTPMPVSVKRLEKIWAARPR